MNAVLKYPGAKNRLAPWICEYIPEHKVYCELFFGSGAVLFNKVPAKIETVNDLDDNVINYFQVIRNSPEELIRRIELTPYGRTEYDKAFHENLSDDEIEKARKFAVRCWMGFGCSNRYKNGFRSSQQSNSPNTTRAWDSFPEILRFAAERLKQVQIENLDALELICRYDTEDVFIYADPPYLHSTRKNYLYRHEMSNVQHFELLDRLQNHPGKVLLSGYDNELYNSALKSWNKVQKHTQAEGGLKRIETLWMNY